jgi:hypothetical protein
MPHRIARLLTLLSTLLIVLSCDSMSRGVAAADRREMARAEQLMDSLIATTRATETADITPQQAVALGYLERLRLGIGSPYRLMAYALHDPRLTPTMRRVVAWSVLARVERGEAYAVADRALDYLGNAPAADAGGSGAAHRALIDSVIGAGHEARDVRAAEEAVRLAYTLARSEQTVRRSSGSLANYAAALARDRVLASQDARRLLHTANRNDDDALRLLEQWRAERLFAVERPLLADEAPDPAHVVREGLRVLELLRARASTELATLAGSTRDSGAAPVGDGAPTTPVVSAKAPAAAVASGTTAGLAEARPVVRPPLASDGASSYLSIAAARRLAGLPSVQGAPPQAPIAISVGAYRRQLAHDAPARAAAAAPSRTAAAALAARQRFAARAVSEEAFVAEYALLRQAGASAADHDLVALTASVAMRSYAQEEVWYAEFGAPTAVDIAYRFGLRGVDFDASVPKAWRPYYLRVLSSAAEELRRVLPDASLSGLSVRIGESVKRDTALALHDPRTRTVYLPTATGAGTIAHELTHDLDWQTARTKLAVRGTYSTDRVARDGQGRLGQSVRGLTAARPTSDPFRQPSAAERPAEVLARSADWFVAAALAREGRMNGYLTSVQDEVLTGYAGSSAPDLRGDASEALMDVLTDMTSVPPETRDWFLARYGRERRPSPIVLARQVLELSPNWSRERAQEWMGITPLLDVPAARASRYELLPGRAALLAGPPACAAGRGPDDAWSATLLRAAAESRARGVLRDRARRWPALGGVRVAPGTDVLRTYAETRAITGGPWDPELAESAVRRLRNGMLRELARQDAARGPIASGALTRLVYGTCAE